MPNSVFILLLHSWEWFDCVCVDAVVSDAATAVFASDAAADADDAHETCIVNAVLPIESDANTHRFIINRSIQWVRERKSIKRERLLWTEQFERVYFLRWVHRAMNLYVSFPTYDSSSHYVQKIAMASEQQNTKHQWCCCYCWTIVKHVFNTLSRSFYVRETRTIDVIEWQRYSCRIITK